MIVNLKIKYQKPKLWCRFATIYLIILNFKFSFLPAACLPPACRLPAACLPPACRLACRRGRARQGEAGRGRLIFAF